MEVKTQGKFIRVSPIKARMVAKEVRGKGALLSLNTLKMMPHKSARIIAKVLKTAISDAEHNFSLDSKDLVISKITVDKGPSFKRFQPVAKGSAHPIEKKTSHITVVVSGETKVQKIKKETPVVKEEEKKEETKKDSVKFEDAKKGPKTNVNQKGFFRRKTG